MIAADQPTIFPDTVLVAVSSVGDGSMKDGTDLHGADAARNRREFMKLCGVDPDRAAIHFADYETDEYCIYKTAVPGLMPGADGATTGHVGQPIFLPLADCVGAVIYDPVHHALMVSHLGRHSTQQFGGTKSIEYMVKQYGVSPEELLVWLGPSPNGTVYPLWAFESRSFTDVLLKQIMKAGVPAENIEMSSVDTATNPNYFSHSQFLKGEQTVDGRYAIVAMLR